MSDALSAEQVAEPLSATPRPWFAHFSIHGDPSIVTDPERPGFTRIASISPATDDYGRANTLLIVEAVNRLAALPAKPDVGERLSELLDYLEDASIGEARPHLAVLIANVRAALTEQEAGRE